MRVNIHGLLDNAKCYQMVRKLRWQEGIECPHDHATEVTKNGRDETQQDRQRYMCRMCNPSFDDLTKTVFTGHHQPQSACVLCLYFMGLNLSNRQIADKLEMNETFNSLRAFGRASDTSSLRKEEGGNPVALFPVGNLAGDSQDFVVRPS